MRWLAVSGLVLSFAACLAVALLLLCPVSPAQFLSEPRAGLAEALGLNPAPAPLALPPPAPLSRIALLGRRIFHDAALSASGRLACAACHDPGRAYGPPNALPAMLGGPNLASQGARAVPSLMYLDRQPRFSIGPDADDPPAMAALGAAALGRAKTAADIAQSAANLVPQGGLFWDGRADTLQDQALGPLLNPAEMANGGIPGLATRLRAAPYAPQFVRLFGPAVLHDDRMLVAEALYALSRYEAEAADFHPYSSKFDAWLQGKARLSGAEMRGYLLFNDPAKGDCAACHLDQPENGQPPLFTDHQFEALGVPRNPALRANRDPDYFDLGICGPFRPGPAPPQFCGMFLTPTLRNVATRRVFFHNGVYRSLAQVLDFYDYRDTRPASIYPRGPGGEIRVFDDLPPAYRGNIDRVDPPFDRHPGQPPPLTPRQERDIIAFLGTLTDGYTPARGRRPNPN